MKAEITKTCTITVEAGSVVEITTEQFALIRDKAIEVKPKKASKKAKEEDKNA